MTNQAVPEHPMAAAREPTAAFRTGSWRSERPVFVERTAPCSEACPLGEDIPAIMALHEQGLHRDALEKILEENPLPGLCGRACFHPCERVCNRARFDEAVSIRDLERFAAEHTPDGSSIEPLQGARPSSVAVLGGGPAGLSCAWFLGRLGHRVTLLEPGDRLQIQREMGGLVPETILEREVERLASMGVEIVTDASTGPDPLAAFSEAYDALYLSSPLPGTEGPIDACQAHERLFTLRGLRQALRAGRESLISGTVAVAGCGPMALEAARLVREQGGRPEVLCGVAREAFGGDGGDLEDAEAEGIDVHFESGLRGLSLEGERFRILPGGPEAPSGTGEPPDSRKEVEADAVVFVPNLKGAQPHWIPCVLPSGLTVLREPAPAGDTPAAERSRKAVRALAAGKQAALILDCSLRGRALDVLAHASPGRLGALSAEVYTRLAAGGTECRPADVVRYEDLNTACFRSSPRSRPHRGKALTPGQAVYSARRCFQCGACTFCGACDDYCPDVSIRLDRVNRRRTVDYEHCKGCGICARECPRGAIVVERESAALRDEG
ncbi:MAG: FAD-dependent oxidoreductase [Deltaproteobacteria bacterium]|nr:FAD-dependent oxidoreductase [Deltaproteobacteria bacterium]